MKYTVTINDAAGQYGREYTFHRFEEALEIARVAKSLHGNRKVVRVYNDDLMDVDTDGLTLAERDQLSSAGVI